MCDSALPAAGSSLPSRVHTRDEILRLEKAKYGEPKPLTGALGGFTKKLREKRAGRDMRDEQLRGRHKVAADTNPRLRDSLHLRKQGKNGHEGPQASIRTMATGGVKPVKRMVAHDREYFVFPNGQWRRQIGEGHSAEERGARRDRDRDNRRVHEAWVASLPPDELAEARRLGVDKYLAGHPYQPSQVIGEEEETEETEPIPEEAKNGTRNGSALLVRADALHLEAPTPTMHAASETLEGALRWVLCGAQAEDAAEAEAPADLVRLGQRAAVLITVACAGTELAAGLPALPHMGRWLIQALTGKTERAAATKARLETAGVLYARVFEWMRRAKDLAKLGQRLQIAAYYLCKGLLDHQTLEAIAKQTGHTRQATNKASTAFRDTFDGFRSIVSRDDITRLLCQRAQLAAA